MATASDESRVSGSVNSRSRDVEQTIEPSEAQGDAGRIADVYLAKGDWEKAIACAETHERTKLPLIYYALGQKHELEGSHQSAIHAYERAHVQNDEIPRMLLSVGKRLELESYVHQADHRELWIWWGRYCAHVGSIDEALAAFSMAGDVLSAIKLYWSQGDRETSLKIAQEKEDKASLFYLARQYASLGHIDKAIDLFADAGFLDNAIHLAMTNARDDALYALVQLAKDADHGIAAYFGERHQWERAATLYAAATDYPKAIDACIRSRSIATFGIVLDKMQQAEGLEKAAAGIQERVVDAFLHFEEYEKAIRALACMGDITRAVNLAEQHEIVIDQARLWCSCPGITSCVLLQELADHLCTGNVASGDSDADRKDRALKVAMACDAQGSWLLAAKKFSEAGERLKAVEALIHSGDVDKVIAFASRSRCPNVFITAANFLRTLDWSENADLCEKIIHFYTRADAKAQLARFHATRAQIEIDDYRDYERGLAALKQERDVLAESQLQDRDDLLRNLIQRIRQIERFLNARTLLGNDHDAAFRLCYTLLEELEDPPEIEAPPHLRSGDVYALLIEFSHMHGNRQHCQNLIDEMTKRGLVTDLYIETWLLQEVEPSPKRGDRTAAAYPEFPLSRDHPPGVSYE